MEGLPFLPGYTFNDVTRQQHNVSHNLVYKNGYPIVKSPFAGVGGEPLETEGVLYCHAPDPVSYDPSLTYGRTQQHVPASFKPHFVLYDKKCLAFKGFYKQGVPNSPNEHYRVHHVNVVYFLEDDTMQISEPTTRDAGYPQGTIVRRCKLPKNTLGEAFHWKDLNNGIDLTANGIVYHICSCDKWTREYLMSQGVEVNENEPLPKDPYTDRRIMENAVKSYKTPPFADKFYKFLVYDKKVLRFTGVWDDRDSEYGTFDRYSILYYLADDTFEIQKMSTGREKEPHTMLLSKTKIPKNWKHTGREFPSIYLEKSDEDLGGFYSPDDLVIGNTIFVFGRRFLIIDCDKATRDFYNDVLHVEQPNPISIEDKSTREILVRPFPKYTGVGTHEDSIQSFYTFNPQPPKLDLVRYLLNMSKILRYMAVMDVVHPDDALRSFIIQYRLSDGYVSIIEEKIRNTGFQGGTFLKYTLVPKYGSDPDNPEYLTPADLYLGAKVSIFSHRFIITGVDLAVYRYMEANPTKFRKEVIDEIRKDLVRKNLLTEDVKEVADFRKREEIAEPMFGEPPDVQPLHIGGAKQPLPNPECLKGKCNAAVGVKAFFDMMHESPQKVMLFGAACTQVTDPIAKASKRWHLTQLSYADTHPMFTSDHFPNFYRVVPSENAFNAPRLELMRQFNWTRVGTIYQNEPRYSLAHNRLVADLDQQRFEVEETQSFTNEVATAISKLKEKDIRIVLGNFNETWARHIFCEAHRAGMTGRKYQWLIMGTYGPSWWLEPAPCPSHMLAQALDGVILTDLLPLATSGEITISGITADEYKEEYDSRRGNEYSRFHGYTYDGVWAVALAIQHVTHRVRHFRKDQTVVDFQYRDPLWERLFIEALKNTSFEGVTGPVRFYDNERKASILLKQFQNGTEVKVGEYNAVSHDLDLDRGQGIRWSGRGPPKDRTLQILEHGHINVAIYSSLAVVASLGIILATVFLAINIKFRNQRYIKMSSPYLNNLIIIGSILTYSSVIFLGLDSRLTSVQAFPYICTARAWLLMAGFSLAFGAMFSKTWRVHSIFTDVKLNKKVIKDYQLYMVVGVLLAIDLGIMTTWQVADPFFRSTKLMEPYPHPHSEDIIIYPENEYCRSHYMNIFVGIIYAYKGLLMIFGAFLAWETRHVSIPALNDSKYVGMSVYNVVLMCIMGAAVSFVLSDEQNAAFVLISFFTIFCATITLCLVFVPKLVELRRNPQGVIDKRIRATLRPTSKTRRDSSELEEKCKEAKNSNQRWRKMLLERENELQNLLKVLGHEDKVNPPPPQEIAQLKKEPPSGTETTEISSVCSNTSSHEDRIGGGAVPTQPAPEYASIVETPAQQKKKTTFGSAPAPAPTKLTSNSTAPASNVPAAALEEMTVGHDCGLSVISESRQAVKTLQHSPSSHSSSKAVSWEECPRGSSNSLRRRSSGVRTSHTPPPQRRTSMPGRRTPTFVHQDELWLTQTRHCRTRCSNPATNEGRTLRPCAYSTCFTGKTCIRLRDMSLSVFKDPTEEIFVGSFHPETEEKVPDDDVSVIQRSVSERRDKCCHGGSSTLPSTAAAAARGTSSLKKPTPAQFQSTPNVLGTALSEGELLDLSILPIFQKLLTERRGAAIASCPNIAIKCDIVEYL